VSRKPAARRDMNVLEFCRDGAATIVCLKPFNDIPTTLQRHSTYCTLANHIWHTILSKVIACLSISFHGDDAREGIVGMQVVFESIMLGVISPFSLKLGKRGKDTRIKKNADSSKMICRLHQRPNSRDIAICIPLLPNTGPG
jgi:hypothetical protein